MNDGNPNGITIDKATIRDTGAILQLVNTLALEQILLPRSPASVIEHIRDFYIARKDGRLIGCGALHIVWSDLAEIRSIAVEPQSQKDGIGRRLIAAMVAEAEALGIPKLFAFTYVQTFFEKVGFHVVEHGGLPHKVFNDCVHCPKFMACDEIAMERELSPPAAANFFGGPVTSIPIPNKPQRVRPTP
jgi:amino-acid N-acetyltransferase